LDDVRAGEGEGKMTGLSHTQLKRWYRSFNRRWFESRLPEDMDVLYVPDDGAHGTAICYPNGELVIEVDTALAGTRFAKMVLLHEMCHHATGDWGHGVRFQAGMARLAMLGAFKGIW
jgi:hypothetical protein